jgi:uncharacterized protein with HEPN domain
MSPAKSDAIRMRHMLEAGLKAIAFVRGRKRSDLDADEQLSLALVRLVEIIGEAAARVESATKDLYPEIPWRKIVGTRNNLIHGYDDVNLNILWQIVTSDLPDLTPKLQIAISKEEGNDQDNLF